MTSPHGPSLNESEEESEDPLPPSSKKPAEYVESCRRRQRIIEETMEDEDGYLGDCNQRMRNCCTSWKDSN